MSDQRYRLRVEVSISDNFGGPGLRISEDCQLDLLNFDEMATLLKGFHELTRSIAAARGTGPASSTEGRLSAHARLSRGLAGVQSSPGTA